MRGGLVVCLMLLARAARADDVDDLVAQGEALAKQGEWTRAVTAFKSADSKRPRAKHACLIGLAYTRRELWAEAELFLSICQQRASADDPAPDWLAEAQHTLGEKLAAAGAAPIAIRVEPADAIALVHVSSFTPDETFTARTIHLPPGTHTITAAAPGYKPAKQEITVTSNAPQDVRLVLVSEHPRPASPTGATRRSRVPWLVVAGGGALALGALAYDQFSVQLAIDDMKKAPTNEVYDQYYSRFETRRDRVYWMLAGAGVLVAAGVALRFTVFSKEEPVEVSALPTPGGGLVTIGWSR